MILWFIHKVAPIRKRYISQWGPKWIKYKVDSFANLLRPGDQVLDIGAGGALISKELMNRGYAVTPLDLENLSYLPEITPVIYDGATMPFDDKSHDVALLLTVLHHTKQPEAILLETKRVAKRIILIEDIYKNVFQKYLTFLVDGIVNWGYSPCPHTNKDDKGWKTTFEQYNLELVSVSYIRVLFFFRQAVYELTSK
ncbi:MAG: class I SAM-dependent methyltransferase [Bacteroidota bacterium]